MKTLAPILRVTEGNNWIIHQAHLLGEQIIVSEYTDDYMALDSYIYSSKEEYWEDFKQMSWALKNIKEEDLNSLKNIFGEDKEIYIIDFDMSPDEQGIVFYFYYDFKRYEFYYYYDCKGCRFDKEGTELSYDEENLIYDYFVDLAVKIGQKENILTN